MPLLRPCKNTAAFEAIPDSRHLRIDLDGLERTLTGQGWTLVVNAAVMLIVRRDVEVSIYQSGKLLIKTKNVEHAQRIVRALNPYVEPGADPEPRLEGLDRLQRHSQPERNQTSHTQAPS